MLTRQKPPQNMDEYIAAFPPQVQEILEKIRNTIRKAAPAALETIKLSNAHFHVKWQFGLFRCIQKPHRVLSALISK